MVTFRPIVIPDSDRRAFKYTGTSSVREGAFCKIASSTTRHTMTCTLAKGNAPTLHLAGNTGTFTTHAAGGTLFIPNQGLVFPIWREDPDIENVGATIDKNDYVIGARLNAGMEFEVHKSALHRTTLGSYLIGRQIVLGTSGKLAQRGMHYDTALVVGICTGTFGGKWLRVSTI